MQKARGVKSKERKGECWRNMCNETRDKQQVSREKYWQTMQYLNPNEVKQAIILSFMQGKQRIGKINQKQKMKKRSEARKNQKYDQAK